jgi:hypothetical protein
VGLRVATPGLAFGALLAGVAGAGGLASLLLLCAVVSGAAAVVCAVEREAVGAADRLPVATAAATLAVVLAAAATHAPTVVLCVLVPASVDALAGLRGRRADPVPSRPALQDLAAEIADPEVSRAA